MKTIYIMACLLSISTTVLADDTCIKEDGQIVLFALPGCSISDSDPEEMLYGHWEHQNGRNEIVCWKYQDMVHVYALDGRVLHYLPTEVVVGCPVRHGSSSSGQPQNTTPENRRPHVTPVS